MRKLVSAGALLFVLGVAFLSKPAVAEPAVPACDCRFCADYPTVYCYTPGPPGRGTEYLCSGYTTLFCP
jgi:hypothetical protein